MPDAGGSCQRHSERCVSCVAECGGIRGVSVTWLLACGARQRVDYRCRGVCVCRGARQLMGWLK